jgi:prepilin-type N-terminal cleavage/methylation domain-containing protein
MHLTSALKQQGLSLLEVLIAVAIASVLLAAITRVVGTALNTERGIRMQNDTLQQARFAMQRMVNAVSNTRRLMIPLGENPVTVWKESERNVLAVTLGPTLDRDKDGWADANNDKDYLDVNKDFLRNTGEPERIDEDLANDNTSDGMPGIIDIDDDGDGSIDEGGAIDDIDDDEDGSGDEEMLDGLDNDSDGSIDEDMQLDMNKDIAAGIKSVDDDFDGSIDEGFNDDDDEDGLRGEDWLDPVVYYLNGSTLMERMPNINPTSGTDYTAYPIADNVAQLLVKRIMGGNGTTALVDITLTLSPSGAEPVTLNTRIGVGSGL